MSAAAPILRRAMRVVIPLRFDANSARDLDAVYELRVRPLPGRQPVSVGLAIAGARCRVVDAPAAGGAAVATVALLDLLALVFGRVGWPQLMSSGRLELTGDPFLALRFPSLFRLPAAGRR